MVDLIDEKEVNGAVPDMDVTESEELGKDTRPVRTNGELIFKHYQANGARGHKETEDVEMQ